jgi:hypothetical protein
VLHNAARETLVCYYVACVSPSRPPCVCLWCVHICTRVFLLLAIFFATALIATRQLICLPAANSFAQAAMEI